MLGAPSPRPLAPARARAPPPSSSRASRATTARRRSTTRAAFDRASSRSSPSFVARALPLRVVGDAARARSGEDATASTASSASSSSELDSSPRRTTARMPSRCADADARAPVRAAIARRRRAMPRDVDRDAADANASSVPAFMGAAPARRRATSTSEAEDASDPKRWRDASNDARHRGAAIAEAAFDALARRARVARDANRAIDVPDDALEALAWLYGAKHLQKALEVMQAGRVRRVVAERSGRSMYAVHGSGAHERAPYLCFPAHFCSCRSFFWECVNRGEALACKHQLAAKLASVLRCAKTTTVDDVLLGNMMMKSFEDDPM